MSAAAPHIPVLLDEVLAALAPQAEDRIVDATFGAGGYARAILDAAPVRLFGFDRDPTAHAAADPMRAQYGDRLALIEAPFDAMEEELSARGVSDVDGIVFDLGVSSMQIDRAERGFSFMRDGPLDMRMGAAGPSAADVVAEADEKSLADIFYVYGEERRSRAVARAIVREREAAPIKTTGRLADVVAGVLGGRDQKTHPATRVFQALRIFVNDELGQLVRALTAAERLLKAGGRLVVVTFHSLEDRIVKRFFDDRAGRVAGGSRHAPEVERPEPTFEQSSRKAVEPGADECAANPRARSAKLRAGRRLDAPARALDAAALGLPRSPADLVRYQRS
ncbi:MAG: 16S rRNA (cytosine(1402)-N(4))-methyltransferase RsmH [Pseudomonadota bacterium]